jgi:hypothetical protein
VALIVSILGKHFAGESRQRVGMVFSCSRAAKRAPISAPPGHGAPVSYILSKLRADAVPAGKSYRLCITQICTAQIFFTGAFASLTMRRFANDLGV